MGVPLVGHVMALITEDHQGYPCLSLSSYWGLVNPLQGVEV
jgi:hypothetical protein